jgi:hypothetical protein
VTAAETEHSPAGGSWVAELEEAKAELAKLLLRSPNKKEEE